MKKIIRKKPDEYTPVEERHCIYCRHYRKPKDQMPCSRCIHETMYNLDQEKRVPYFSLKKGGVK